jgi:hypothetical protein
MTGHATESLIAARRRDSTRRRQRVLSALDQLAAAGQEISVSAVARAAGVDRSFLYRHHDLRAANRGLMALANRKETGPG